MSEIGIIHFGQMSDTCICFFSLFIDNNTQSYNFKSIKMDNIELAAHYVVLVICFT